MFGKILSIDNNELTIVNAGSKAVSNLMNCHIVLEEETRRLVAEIIYMDESVLKALLVGEIVNNKFVAGTIRKPSANALIRVINSQELELIFGSNNITKDRLFLGKSAIYPNFNISIPLDNWFSAHSAIIGNTGSGKSCSVARLLQNLYFSNEPPVNSHIVLFDAYGEYSNTFNEMNNKGLHYTKWTNKVLNEGETQLKFPAYFLDVDDLAILLQVQIGEQIPVLDKTLRLVRIFKSNDPKIKEYKNNIIANCLLDILTSGRPSSHIRDQIVAVLSKYNTENLSLESIIYQPGYSRTLRQCLLIDDHGKMNAIAEVIKFLEQFDRVNLNEIPFNENCVWNLEDIYYALEFALISEGNINSDVAYKQNNILKTRLQTLIKSDKKNIFACDTYISKEDFIKSTFGVSQLITIDLSFMDDRFAKAITKLYSKLIFNYATSNYERGGFTTNIILEEAHRYVQNDTDIDIIGYNIFDRITKEGRKYGTLLTFITQRPSELSETALSQCANFIVFRVFFPKDLEIVKNMSSNVSMDTIEQIKSLNPGMAFAFGTGFKIPTLISFALPDPMPESTSIEISKVWF